MNATANRRPRALLLDDDPTVLGILGSALEARGFDVLAATDGDSGVALLIDELLRLDVVVADDALPVRDAPSLLRLIRCKGGERDLGLVVLGDGSPTSREQLIALGADEVVDRRRGPAVAADAVVSVLRRRDRGTGAAPDPAPPAWRSALLAARAALAPGSALDPAPA